MRILLITWDYLPTYGGIQNYIEGLSHYLKEIGIEVNIISKWNPLETPKSQIINDIKVFRIRYPYFRIINIKMLPRFIWRSFQCIFEIVEIIKSFYPNIIHCNVAYPPGLFGVMAAKLCGRLAFITCHGFDINYSFKKAYGIRRFLSGRLLSNISLSLADRILSPSKNLAETIRTIGFPAGKISVIPNGIDLKTVKKRESLVRKTLGIGSNPIVLFVGRLEPIKGADILLLAAKRILEEIPSTFFILVGSGSMEKKLRELSIKLKISKRVIFTGAKSQDQLSIYYSAADVFVQPSFSEAFGMSLCEALACQTPVVASNVGGIKEFIENNLNGILVPPGNPGLLKEAIVYLIKNPEIARKMAEEGKKIVFERFRWEKIARQIVGEYIRTLKQKGY